MLDSEEKNNDKERIMTRQWNNGKNMLIAAFPKRIRVIFPELMKHQNVENGVKDVWLTSKFKTLVNKPKHMLYFYSKLLILYIFNLHLTHFLSISCLIKK